MSNKFENYEKVKGTAGNKQQQEEEKTPEIVNVCAALKKGNFDKKDFKNLNKCLNT